MIGKRERCLSPWFGFLIIVGVCVVIAGAIFFEFKGTRRHGKANIKKNPRNAAVQVNFRTPQADTGTTADKFIF